MAINVSDWPKLDPAALIGQKYRCFLSIPHQLRYTCLMSFEALFLAVIMSRRMTAALVLLFVAICTLSADPVVALKSKLAVQPQDGADTHVDHHDHVDHHGHDHDEADTVVRCRFCGAAVALKKYGRGNLPRLFGYADAVCARMLTDVGVHGCRDYIALHDTSKAVASKRENILGDDGELHTFVNPSRVSSIYCVAKRHGTAKCGGGSGSLSLLLLPCLLYITHRWRWRWRGSGRRMPLNPTCPRRKRLSLTTTTGAMCDAAPASDISGAYIPAKHTLSQNSVNVSECLPMLCCACHWHEILYSDGNSTMMSSSSASTRRLSTPSPQKRKRKRTCWRPQARRSGKHRSWRKRSRMTA